MKFRRYCTIKNRNKDIGGEYEQRTQNGETTETTDIYFRKVTLKRQCPEL